MKISVITAVYNNIKTVKSTIESLLSQSFDDVELIVIDGGSTDGTLQVLKDYSHRLSVLVSEPDQGIYYALNKGIEYATGDVVGFLHADDIYENINVLARISSAFQDANIDAVYGDLVYVQQDDVELLVRYWKSGHYYDGALSRGWMPPHPTFYVRRTVYERLGCFDTRYRISADYDVILRFISLGKIRMFYITEVLVRMRLGGISNRSLRTIFSKTIEDFRVIKRNQVGGIFTLISKNLRKLPQFLRH